ncbi:hypothetical protein ACNI4G_10770 [Gordonia amicalis]
MARALLTDVSLGACTSRKGGVLLRVHSRTGLMHAGFDLTTEQTAQLVVDLVESLGWSEHQTAVDAVDHAINVLQQQKQLAAKDAADT